jgi:hypothetical protein
MAVNPTTVETVTMADGAICEFPGKRQMLKSHTIGPNGELMVRFDFRNGEFRLFTLPDALLSRFAIHGAEQKIGDAAAGLALEDSILAVDDVIENLYNGQWNSKREASGFAGASILARALVEVTGQPIDKIKANLKALTTAQRNAMKNNAKIRPVVDRLEAEAAAKKGTAVDSDALLEAFAA